MPNAESAIDEINRLHKEAERIASESRGEFSELKKVQAICREACKVALKAVEQYPDDGMLWHLLLGSMGESGAWDNADGDYHEMRLVVINNMIRLNPDDDQEAYAGSVFEPDYAFEGGLYALKFEALIDQYYLGEREAGWPDSEHGKEAREALEIIHQRFPEQRDYVQEQAEAADIKLG